MDSFYSAPVCLILYPFVLNGVLSVRASKRLGNVFTQNIEGKHEGRSKRPVLTQEPVECEFSRALLAVKQPDQSRYPKHLSA